MFNIHWAVLPIELAMNVMDTKKLPLSLNLAMTLKAIVNKEHELLSQLLHGVDEQEIETFSKVLAALKNNAGKF
ncbi:hypothetical protein AGMMS4957_15110 [Bacteroidia bacterium]|nr:hypothetical protein AGMMS4957_15110 [Bacteroidia bacterium]